MPRGPTEHTNVSGSVGRRVMSVTSVSGDDIMSTVNDNHAVLLDRSYAAFPSRSWARDSDQDGGTHKSSEGLAVGAIRVLRRLSEKRNGSWR